MKHTTRPYWPSSQVATIITSVKFFCRWFLPLIILAVGTIEGIFYSMELFNQPSDLAVLGGASLLALTLVLSIGLGMRYAWRVLVAITQF